MAFKIISCVKNIKQSVTFFALAIVLSFFTPSNSLAMETLGGIMGSSDKEGAVSSVDELSPCGQKITEFKFYLKDGQRCVRDTDCMVIKGECPLGCRFYINKVFEGILSSRIKDIPKLCEGMVCSALCPPAEEWNPPVCNNDRCVADI